MLFSDPIAGPAETLVADLRDYPEWHRGRRRYGVWIVPVDDPMLRDYIADVRSQLADLIHADTRRQAHVTVFVCGFHGAGAWDDDFPLPRLDRQIAMLESCAGDTCTLPLARLDSFASAAFIPVGDPMGRLARWRRALGEASREIRPSNYVPHITLGLYRQRVPAQAIRERLDSIAAPPSSLMVTELQYVTYDAHDHFGSLHGLRRVALAPAVEMVERAP